MAIHAAPAAMPTTAIAELHDERRRHARQRQAGGDRRQPADDEARPRRR